MWKTLSLTALYTPVHKDGTPYPSYTLKLRVYTYVSAVFANSGEATLAGGQDLQQPCLFMHYFHTSHRVYAASVLRPRGVLRR